jgi:CRISPR-associated protein Csm3
MSKDVFRAELKGFRRFTATIRCETGLRIGASRETAGPGELESPIVRHPISRIPYIPGSSLKGKLRALLESRHSRRTQETGFPCDCAEYERCAVCRLFGCGDPRKSAQPTRLIFRDAALAEPSAKELREAMTESGIFFSEAKGEIAMNRSRGTARPGSLRQAERVPAGAEFALEVVLRVFAGDDEEANVRSLVEALDLLELDYLGGSGTRGYGKVKIADRVAEPLATVAAPR